MFSSGSDGGVEIVSEIVDVLCELNYLCLFGCDSFCVLLDLVCNGLDVRCVVGVGRCRGGAVFMLVLSCSGLFCRNWTMLGGSTVPVCNRVRRWVVTWCSCVIAFSGVLMDLWLSLECCDCRLIELWLALEFAELLLCALEWLVECCDGGLELFGVGWLLRCGGSSRVGGGVWRGGMLSVAACVCCVCRGR